VCPAQTETYTLHIIHPGGEENWQITVSLIAATATTVLPVPAAGQQAAPNLTTATLLPTAVPSPATTSLPATTAVMSPVETAVPSLPPTLTREFVQIIVPPLPTATEAATTAALLPPATTIPSSPPEAAPAAAPNQWLTYAIFGMIVFGLGAMLLLAKR
jgi:hypothetical protein